MKRFIDSKGLGNKFLESRRTGLVPHRTHFSWYTVNQASCTHKRRPNCDLLAEVTVPGDGAYETTLMACMFCQSQRAAMPKIRAALIALSASRTLVRAPGVSCCRVAHIPPLSRLFALLLLQFQALGHRWKSKHLICLFADISRMGLNI